MNVETIFFVDITQDHINAGNNCEEDSCAITLAVADAVPQARRIKTDCTNVSFMLDRYEYRDFQLSDEGMNFVHRFDANLPVEPFCLLLREL